MGHQFGARGGASLVPVLFTEGVSPSPERAQGFKDTKDFNDIKDAQCQ